MSKYQPKRFFTMQVYFEQVATASCTRFSDGISFDGPNWNKAMNELKLF